MRVFLAWHTRVESDSEDSKLLGVYSSEAAAHAAIGRPRDKPGFRVTPMASRFRKSNWIATPGPRALVSTSLQP